MPSPRLTAPLALALFACEPTFTDQYCLDQETPTPACAARLGALAGGGSGGAGSSGAGAAGRAPGGSGGNAGSAGNAGGNKAGTGGASGGNGGSSGKAGAAGSAGKGGKGGGGQGGGGAAGKAGAAGSAGGAGSAGSAGSAGCTGTKSECEAIVQLAMGRAHVCYVRADGRVYCWGEEGAGQLGLGTVSASRQPSPQKVNGIDDAVRVAAGNDTTCVVRKTGAVACWGADDDGQLGRGNVVTGNARAVPTDVVTLTAARDVVLGAKHACAATSDGKLRCWGDNAEGQLDQEPQLVSRTPVVIALAAPATLALGGLSAGATRTCAVQTGLGVSCLGNQRFAPAEAPVTTGLAAVAKATSASLVTQGAAFGCALQPAAGTVACWGRADEGQLGIDPAEPAASTISARVIPSLESLTSLAAGEAHVCGGLATGEVFCWGACTQGQCGDGVAPGGTTRITTPALVPDLANVQRVYAGARGTCVVLTTGALSCWGEIAGAVATASPEAVTLP